MCLVCAIIDVKRTITHKPRWKSIAVYGIPVIISALFAFLYVGMQMFGLYGGDAGDLVTNGYLFGIPHPPGYPLYTLLAGLISHTIPWNSIEWRVGLISSLPTALSLFFLWRVIFRITKSFFATTLAVISYGLLGPVWISAITQEVFGLFSLFVVVWIERFITWIEEKQTKQLLFLSFWTGLSLTHHQLIILCIIPAVFLVISRYKDLVKQVLSNWWKILLCVLIGLLPYLYIPVSARFSSLFSQENVSTIEGFFRLVTRASYGSFRASANMTPTIIDRLLNIFTFFQFSLRDIGFIGIFALFVGVVVLRKKQRDVYDYLIGCLFLWIFYFFYAGFPQLLNYQIGTIERFFVIPYQYLIIFLSIGISWIIKRISNTFLITAFCVLLLYVSLPRMQINFRAFTYLKNDHSMEKLADDFFASAPKKSILFLSEDTTIYSMYDALYVHKLRPDIHFIRIQFLSLPHYRAYVRQTYPDLYIPPEKFGTLTSELISDFMTRNMQQFPIMSDQPISWIDGLWLPHGLLYLYFPDKDGVLDYAPLYEINQNLWKQFFVPESLFLYQKELPMLSDVLRVYSQHRVNLANIAILAHMPLTNILPELQEALRLAINIVPEYYLSPVVLLLKDNRCSDAKEVLAVVYKTWGADKAVLRQYVSWQDACGVDDEVDGIVTLFRKQFPKETDALSK